MDVGKKTKLFVIGGENLLSESLLSWRDGAPSTRLINEYGPTETVVGCCVHEVSASDPRTGPVPIGRPIANTQLYVLDRHMNPLPPGVAGELYIGGAGVARGYLNRPELTRERFLADPFVEGPGRCLYKTGDLVRHRVDGTLEYLGRTDDQVKIRGYRIELGEIESKLAQHVGIRSCAVMVDDSVPGNKKLVAYVVLAGARPPVEELRASLEEFLPAYMVPSEFAFIDAMPLTSNGKVDRKALGAMKGAENLRSGPPQKRAS
jgi:acyl-coenzyme A synthetase/AMP-(fatty) acid ligase